MVAKRTELRFHIRRDEHDLLKRKAAQIGRHVHQLARDYLAPILRDEPLPTTRLHIWLLRRRLDELRDDATFHEAQLARLEPLIHAREPGSLLRTLLQEARDDHRARLHVLHEKIHRTEQEVTHLMTLTTPAHLALALPPTLLASAATGDAGAGFPWPPVLLVAAAAITACLIAAKKRGWIRMPRLSKRWAPSGLALRGPDAGAPRITGFSPNPGHDDAEYLDAFWHDPLVLHHHLQVFLDQPDGLERLRIAFEDADLETYDETDDARRNGGAGRPTLVRIIAMTTDQFDELPAKHLQRVLSRRSRPIVIPADAPPDAALGRGNGARPRPRAQRDPRRLPPLLDASTEPSTPEVE